MLTGMFPLISGRSRAIVTLAGSDLTDLIAVQKDRFTCIENLKLLQKSSAVADRTPDMSIS